MGSFFLKPPLTHIIDLLLLSLVVLAAYTLAERFLNKYFNVKFSSGLEKFVFLEGLGLGAFAYLTLILGLCGLLYRWLFYSLLLIALLVTGDRIIRLIKNIRFRLPIFRSRSETVLSVLLLIFVLCSLLSALAPPTGIDENMYHLTVPKLYVQHHKIYNIPEIMRSGWIMTQEMLYTIGFLLKGDILAKLFHFLMGILTMLAIYSFSSKYMSKSASLLASLIFISTPMVFWLSTVANNDLGLAFFELLAAYGMINWLISKQDGWLKLAAVFCGLALVTKYLGIFAFMSIILLMIGLNIHNRKKDIIKNMAAFIAISLSVAAIWYLRNCFYFQNPIFPFLNNIFRSKYWLPEFWLMDFEQFGMGKGIADYLLIPWNLTFHCRFFSRVGYIGPIFLMTLPLLLLGMINKVKVHSAIKYLLMYTVIIFGFWAFSSQYVRYAIPIFPMLSILAAYAVYGLEPVFKENIFKAILAVVMAVLFLNLPFFTDFWVDSEQWGPYCYTVSYADYAHGEDMKYFKLAREVVFGRISRDDYLSNHPQTRGTYPLIKYINDELPANTKVLTIYDFMLYYHDRDVRCDYDFFPEYGTWFLEVFASPGKKYYPGMWTRDFLQKLKGLKVTHLLVNVVFLRWAGVDLVKDERFSEFARSYLKPIKFTREAVLYEVLYDRSR